MATATSEDDRDAATEVTGRGAPALVALGDTAASEDDRDAATEVTVAIAALEYTTAAY